MFFWVVLGSLISVLSWGKFSESAKSPDDYVVPVYEALVSSLSQQNKMATEYVQKKLKMFETTGTALEGMPPRTPADSGFMFAIGADGKVTGNPEMVAGGKYFMNSYQYFKMADGFKSAYFCVYGNAQESIVTSSSAANIEACRPTTQAPVAVLIVTYGLVPYRYSTKSMHYLFKAAERVEPGSKTIGFLKRMNNNGDGTFTDIPVSVAGDSSSTVYRIYAQGVADKNAFFIPKGVVEFIKANDGVASLAKYVVAVEVVKYKGASCTVRWRNCG